MLVLPSVTIAPPEYAAKLPLILVLSMVSRPPLMTEIAPPEQTEHTDDGGQIAWLPMNSDPDKRTAEHSSAQITLNAPPLVEMLSRKVEFTTWREPPSPEPPE